MTISTRDVNFNYHQQHHSSKPVVIIHGGFQRIFLGALCFRASTEKIVQNDQVPASAGVTMPAVPLENWDKYEELINCSTSEAIRVCNETIGQSLTKTWYKVRKHRISASKVHEIVHAKTSSMRLKYFFQS